MTKNANKLGGLSDLYFSPSFLEQEKDSKFLEWYLIEGFERLNELERQLRTYCNYKCSVIRFRFSGSQKSKNFLKNDHITKWKSKLLSKASRLASVLKRIGAEEISLAKKMQILIEKVKAHPNGLEKGLLNEICNLSHETWKSLHILSEFEIHHNYQLLHLAIKIAIVSCDAERIFFSLFSDFYNELKQNYVQLDKEISGLLNLNGEERFEKIKKNTRVKISE